LPAFDGDPPWLFRLIVFLGEPLRLQGSDGLLQDLLDLQTLLPRHPGNVHLHSSVGSDGHLKLSASGHEQSSLLRP